MILALAGCAAEVGPGPTDSDVGAAEAPLLGAEPLPREVIQLLAHAQRDELTDEQLDHVYELHHHIRVGTDRRMHVTETFTLRSWLEWPHRGAMLLPGTLVNGGWFNIDVDGYRLMDTLAQRGFFVFAVDYEGTGESTYPANGYDVTHDYLVDANRRVLRAIRLMRLIPRVDVIGESNGGGVAAELCSDGRAVRSCVVSSMLYVEPTPFYNAVFLDPGFVWFLSNQPNGYLDVGPELYFNITARMTPEVRDATLATQPDRYALGYVISPFPGLPWYDVLDAEVPGLVIQGTEDNIATQHDIDLLAAAWGSEGGGEATVVRIEGGGHIPRVEPAPICDQWTEAVIAFVDPG